MACLTVIGDVLHVTVFLLGRGGLFFVAAGTSRKYLQKATAGYAPVAEVVEEEPRTQMRCVSSPCWPPTVVLFCNAWTTLPHGAVAYRVSKCGIFSKRLRYELPATGVGLRLYSSTAAAIYFGSYRRGATRLGVSPQLASNPPRLCQPVTVVHSTSI